MINRKTVDSSYGDPLDSKFNNRLGNMLISELLWIIGFNLLIFQNPIKSVFPIASYFDEIATIFLLVAAALAVIQTKGSRRQPFGFERLAIALLILLVAVGLLGNYIAKIQTNVRPILIDVYACTKFVITFLSGSVAFEDKQRVYGALVCEIKILILIMIPFAIINQFVDLGMRYDKRYGLWSFQFIFGHPSSFAAVLSGFSLLLLVDNKKNSLWITLCWLLILLGLRSTSIAFVGASIVVISLGGSSQRLRMPQVLLLAAVVIYIGWSQFQYYYFSVDGSARAELTSVAVEIANKYSPLGSGFATYGSNITAQPGYYSALYFQYGLSSVFGLEPGNTTFLSDTFWPIIIGQFGWLGLILFVPCLFSLYKGVSTKLKLHASSNKVLFLLFVYLLLSSLGGSGFFHPMAVLLTMCGSLANAALIKRSVVSAYENN